MENINNFETWQRRIDFVHDKVKLIIADVKVIKGQYLLHLQFAPSAIRVSITVGGLTTHIVSGKFLLIVYNYAVLYGNPIRSTIV